MSAKKFKISAATRKLPTSRKDTNSTLRTEGAATATPVVPGPRVLTTSDIGEVAGEIWGLLAEKDGQPLAAIKKSIDAPPDVVVAAVGWLAREDKLEFVTSGRTLKIALRR